jgi:hypothetical protein
LKQGLRPGASNQLASNDLNWPGGLLTLILASHLQSSPSPYVKRVNLPGQNNPAFFYFEAFFNPDGNRTTEDAARRKD